VLVQSLAQFGTLAEVTAKVVAAEREKVRARGSAAVITSSSSFADTRSPLTRQESTLSVEVLASRERQTASGAAVYEIDYLLDSSRGRKRVLNAVCITNATLYIYALQFKARARRSCMHVRSDER
jgi:cell pole-organizing protein PopZ